MTSYSIIVPYYRPYHEYFKECLNSILLNNYENYEIILVVHKDDYLFLLNYIQIINKNKIKIIQSNYTDCIHNRNIGLENANNDYIVFVDSDDLISRDFLETGNDIINKYKPDLCAFEMTRDVNTLNNKYGEIIFTKKIEDFYKQFLKLYSFKYEHFKQSITCYSAVWNKIFKKVIIDKYHIRFDANSKIGEDGCFVIDYVLKLKSLLIYPNYYAYFWRTNSNSITGQRQKITDYYDMIGHYSHLKESLSVLDYQYKERLPKHGCDTLNLLMSDLIEILKNNQESIIQIYRFLSKVYFKESELYNDIKTKKEDLTRFSYYVINKKKFKVFAYLIYKKIFN